MAQDIVQILFNEFGLKMSRNMQRQIDNQRTYHQNAKLAATALPPMQEFREPDPMEMFISQAKTTRGRKGKRAFAFGALKRYTSGGASLGERLGHVMKHMNMDLGKVIDTYHITKKIGKRDIPNYGSLTLGQPYVSIESYRKGRYSYHGDTENIRLRIIIPRVISPRGTNVYGDEITIEEPGYKSFGEKEGWRCYLSKFYDVDKPKGAGGKLIVLEDSQINLVHLPTLLNASDRPFPFLINWTLDSKSIAERF